MRINVYSGNGFMKLGTVDEPNILAAVYGWKNGMYDEGYLIRLVVPEGNDNPSEAYAAEVCDPITNAMHAQFIAPDLKKAALS